MKYYVTADVHGYFSQMKKALEEAGFFDDTEPHKLIVLGDLFDRGKEAKKLQSFVLDLMRRDEAILIKGNHEDLLVELATVDQGAAYRHHVQNGTYETGLQLTDFHSGIAFLRPLDFAEVIQATPLFREIIPAMVDYYETEKHVFVHGWIPCIRDRDGKYSSIVQWREASKDEWAKARWYNGMAAAAQSVTVDDKTVVCGHWHTSYGHSQLDGKGSEFGAEADFSPYYAPGIIALDACTAHSGKVNCILIEE